MTSPLSAKITIQGTYSKLEGDYLVDDIRLATSWPVEGARYSDAYQKGKWDGRKHLFSTRNGKFPTGLVPTVEQQLVECGIPYEVVDERIFPAPDPEGTYELEGISFDYPFEYELEAAKLCIEKKQGILSMATNSGKTECACAVTNMLRVTTLFVVPTKELLHQTRARFIKRLGVTEKEVGILGDGKWEPGTWVTISTLGILDSRSGKPACRKFLSTVELLFVDECHHSGSETWYELCMLCPAVYRFGLSGTPLDRTDGADLRLIAALGDVLVEIKNKFLVDRGVSARAHIVCDKVTEPLLPRGTPYPSAYKLGVVENEEMLDKAVQWTKICYELGLSVLILTEEIKHGRLVNDALWNNTGDLFIPHQFIYGEDATSERQEALDAFADRSLPVLVASRILDEGIDVPTVDVLIPLGSRKSKIKTLQRLGRGLRGKKLIVVEFMNFCHNYLCEHSFERLQDYKAEDCFPIHSSAPNKALIERIWNEEKDYSGTAFGDGTGQDPDSS